MRPRNNVEVADELDQKVLISVTITLPIVYYVRRRSTRPWFRRKVIHKGSGQLPGPE